MPLDGSPLAEQVLPYVSVLGKAFESSVLLFRVFDPVPSELADPAHGLYIDRLATAFRNTAQEYLGRVKSSMTELGDAVSTSAHEGDAASLIVNEAANDPNTLITMSTHGRSGISRWVLGSVVDKVLRAAGNSLMIIRARPQEGFDPGLVATRTERWNTSVQINNLIVPVDGSESAEEVLPHAVALAKGFEAKLSLVRVAPDRSRDGDANAYLGQVAQRLRQDGVSSVEEQLLHGEPAGALLDMVQPMQEAFVAMTTRGRSGLERWVLGSVTDRVVRYSGTPVLVVRGG